MIRICPERDRVCPHGMNCPWADERYSCKPGWETTPQQLAALTQPTGSADLEGGE